MTTYAYNYEIGIGGTLNLQALTIPINYPKSTYHPYSQMLDIGDGTVRGGGWPTATWHWDFLPKAQRDALRQIITGASRSVNIRTKVMDSDAYVYFTAVAIWPIESEERDAGRRLNFDIQFRNMVAYTP